MRITVLGKSPSWQDAGGACSGYLVQEDGYVLLVDGGIRDGADVVRALALGARAVLVGRPYAWGLAADGERGVRAVLDGLTEDVALALALVGATSASAVDPAVVVR